MKKLLIFLSFTLFSANSFGFTLVSNTIIAGWDTESLTFNVNETSCTNLGISSSVLNAAIDSAIDLWNSAPTTSLKLVKGSVVSTTTASNPPSINCSNTAQTDTVAGVGTISSTLSGRPYTGFLTLNGDNTKSAYFGNLSTTEQAIIVAHEIGHVLGLGHSEKTYALMYYDISSKTHLNLSQDDVDGLTWLNPRNELTGGVMGCANVEDISRRKPPSNGTGAVAFNWCLMILLAFAASKFRLRRFHV